MTAHPNGADRFLETLSEVLKLRRYLVTLVIHALTAGVVRYWLGKLTWTVLGWLVHLPFDPGFVGYLCALGPLIWSASSFWHPGDGWLWHRLVGAFDPSERELAAIMNAITALGPEAVEGLGGLSVYVIDRSEPFAFVRGNSLIVSRGLVEGDSLVAVLSHELNHACTIDGRLIQALDRLVLFGDPLARARDEDTLREFGKMAALVTGALRWALRIAGGALTQRMLAPLWAPHWRQRERAADERAVKLGQGPPLAEHLEAWVQPTDRPHPRLLFNLQEYERTAYRIDVLAPETAL